jgi:hypothetical protein
MAQPFVPFQGQLSLEAVFVLFQARFDVPVEGVVPQKLMFWSGIFFNEVLHFVLFPVFGVGFEGVFFLLLVEPPATAFVFAGFVPLVSGLFVAGAAPAF